MEITFIKPVSLKGPMAGTTENSVTLFSAIKGRKRKTTSHTLNINKFLQYYKLGWNYAQVGINNDGEIVIAAGNEFNGYKISKGNQDLTNTLLNTALITHLGLRVPINPDAEIKIVFTPIYLPGSNVYILKPIL
jgi:hypothetical protein